MFFNASECYVEEHKTETVKELSREQLFELSDLLPNRTWGMIVIF